MTIKKLGPNMTELQYSDGRRVLVSYETPCAAFTPRTEAGNEIRLSAWWKSNRFHSRTTSAHVSQWLKENGAQDVVAVLPETIAGMME